MPRNLVTVVSTCVLFMFAPPVSAQCSKGFWETSFDHLGTMPTLPTCGLTNPVPAFPREELNALHMSVIPKGAHQGHVIVWDHLDYGNPTNETRVFYWSIVDPVAKQFWNYAMCMPAGQGDLFCAGHAWTEKGDLLVAGGTGCHAHSSACNAGWGGSKLAYVWQPPTVAGTGGTWIRINPGLDTPRWYPSLTCVDDGTTTGESRIMVSGGTHLGLPNFPNGKPVNSFQMWRPIPTTAPQGSFPAASISGPKPGANPTNFELHIYPRMHFLSTGFVATAGMVVGSDRTNPYPPSTWLHDTSWTQAFWPINGTSVLFPIPPGGAAFKDYVLSIGGLHSTGVIVPTVETSLMTANGTAKNWQQGNPSLPPDLAHKRHAHNVVLLPDTTILVVGGEQTCSNVGASASPALIPEVYVPSANAWIDMNPHTIIRDYHSTAVVLPNGKVLTGGGDNRDYYPNANCNAPPLVTAKIPNSPKHDYQIFKPHYLNCGFQQPSVLTFANAGSALTYVHGQSYIVQHTALSLGNTISKVVLVRGGSVTHQADNNQRCCELSFLVVPDTDPPNPNGYTPTLQVTVPTAASRLLPRGYYTMFLVTSQGGVSVPATGTAPWVQVVQ